ncbi:Ribonuclease H-like superfamily protein [Rhynchospora pubera]|uniref:Ribonuclease H-like superfamily protein n=1 Tax=Rhynchospora pubera TaxID=906938 RepID=A0AAV8GVE7_9POAL|nr:Ribonuclease H-like superfamily protein [Rhynchospora pubera]KAJ4807251.1 Ribonuclease H-like superfamily protein [Rhynchospora pubera]
MTLPDGPTLSQREDRLIFTASRNGQFSIKSAYRLLLMNAPNSGTPTIPRDICSTIWHTKNILPRARLFLWRAAHEALPVDAVFSSRLARQSGGCSICGAHQETAAHVLFKCPQAQQVWLTSQFGLRTDLLPDTVHESLDFFIKYLDMQLISKLVAIMWQLWKDRCKHCFEGKRSRPQQTLAATNRMLLNLQTADKLFSTAILEERGPPNYTKYTCWTDASWVQSGHHGAGLAFVLFDHDKLVGYWLTSVEADTPFHAELLSLKKAIRRLLDLGITDCTFKTDCLLLKQLLCGETNVSEVDWQAFHEAMDTKLVWDDVSITNRWHCTHISRDFNILADQLAN